MRDLVILLVIVIVAIGIYAATVVVQDRIAENNATTAQQVTQQKAYEAQRAMYDARIAEMNKEIEYMRESNRTERFQLTLVALSNGRYDILPVLAFMAALAFAGVLVWRHLNDRY